MRLGEETEGTKLHENGLLAEFVDGLGKRGSWLVVSPGCPPTVESRAREGGQEC